MTPYRLTATAKADIAELAMYIGNVDEATARSVVRRLTDAFERIAAFPGIGHARPELRDERLRVVFVSGFLVVYHVATRPVTVLRVLRASRRLGLDALAPTNSAKKRDAHS